MKSTSSILLAGGDGFLGRALTQRFLERGRRVVVVDDHSTSVASPPTPNGQVIEADVVDCSLDGLGPLDGILHLASPAAPTLFADRPREVLRPNIHGTERLLDLAAANDCRMLYFSSSEVYGDAPGGVEAGEGLPETSEARHGLLTERSVYAVAKRAGEELVRAARRFDGVDAAVVRPFNVYGPGMDPTLPIQGRVIPNFLRAVEKGKPLRIHGDGEQVRSFLWIDDFVDAVMRLFDLETALPLAVNVGRDEPVSINRLADELEVQVGRPLERVHVQRSEDDVDWRRPDCSLLRSLTGWEPQVTLAQGLARLLETKGDVVEATA